MMKYHMRSQTRGREDIIADILEIASSPIRQTVIMYRANLSYSQLRFYLDLLESKQMLAGQEENNYFYWLVTAKGREYLRVYAELQRTMGEQKEPNQVSMSSAERNLHTS